MGATPANDDTDTASATYTPAGGPRLAEFLDGLPVVTRWLAGHHVTWMTGQQDRADGLGREDASHCSAFVAAVAMALDIYVLRPPNKSQELLANAQHAWLDGDSDAPGPDAATSGWEPLGTSGRDGVLTEAVARANAGDLVLAAYAQAPTIDPVTGARKQHAGHIAIVWPQAAADVGDEGPLMISAGATNYQSATMKTVFQDHHGAWPAAIALYACPSPLAQDSPPGETV